jgi:hypothetical protein
MRVLRFAFATFVLFALAAAAQDRYVDRTLNFSVATPAPEWTWAQVDRSNHEALGGCDGILVVSSPHGDRFSVAVSPTGRYRLEEATMYDLVMAIQRDGRRNGYKVADFHHVRSTAPIFPSYTFSYTRIGRDGKVSYVDGYLAAANRLYTIQYASSSRKSLDDFRRFVGSFQIADKFEAMRGSGAITSPFAGLPGAMKSFLGQPLGPNSLEPITR